MKQRKSARAFLRKALDIFEDLGAPLWSAKVDAELARIGGRTSTPGQLSGTEHRVAELAATGSTNREIAGRLFISVKTVESNLSRVYHKLGLRSRRELRPALDDLESSRAQT
jgi:DNA-binding CsgD family transcriptional regulator